MKATSDGSSCPMTIRTLSCTGFRNGSACRFILPGQVGFGACCNKNNVFSHWMVSDTGQSPSSEVKRSFWSGSGRPLRTRQSRFLMTPARLLGSRSALPGSPDSFVLEPQQLAYALSSQHLHRAFHRTGLSPLFHPL